MKPVTVRFQDQGQDFLEFDIKGGRVIAARPFQADIWSGMEVLNEIIYPGDYIVLRCEHIVRTLRYPVAEVRSLTTAVQIGPVDV